MLLVGELINTSRKAVRIAVEKGDPRFIGELAVKQAKAGVDYVDVNCGTRIDDEKATMAWLIDVVQESVECPLCIDSPNPAVIEMALRMAKNGQPMVNSITGGEERMAAMLPALRRYGAKVVALCMDTSGVPRTAQERISVAHSLIHELVRNGVNEGDIYVDPLVVPISTDAYTGRAVLDCVRRVRTEFPRVHTICGLSNISYGLPNRRVLNQTFMVQAMVAGIDSYILDPLDRRLMGLFYSSRALLGEDPYCSKYLQMSRAGLYDSEQPGSGCGGCA